MQAIRSQSRIDISATKVVFSVHPDLGDVCYDYGTIDQFIFSNGIITSSSFANRFYEVNALVAIDHNGTSFYNQYSNRVFQGPQLLCVSTYYRRAFVTTVASLAEDIWGHQYYIRRNFTAPVIFVGNSTVFVNTSNDLGIIQVGDSISAPNGTYVTISVVLAEPGVPPATVTRWSRNNDVFETDPDKNQVLSANGFVAVLTRLRTIHAGVYNFSISNIVGSHSATTFVTYRPNDCKLNLLSIISNYI